MFKAIKQSVYLLQLENYNLRRFWKVILKRPFIRSKFRQKIVWTPKLALVFSLSTLLQIMVSYLAARPLRQDDVYLGLFPLVFIFVFLLLSFAHSVFLTLAVLILRPIDYVIKGYIVNQAKLKIGQLSHDRGIAVQDQKNFKIIGITGSFGKTTMKEVLSTILEEKFNVLRTPESVNTPVGISRLILSKLTADTEVFIVEMGAYQRGDIRSLCEIATPDIAVLTGINEAHLERFGRIENTVQAKFEIVENAKGGALILLNEDSALVRENYPRFTGSKKAILYNNAPQPPLSLRGGEPTPKSSTLLGDPGQGRGRTRVFTTLHDVGFKDYPELYDKLSLWYHRFSAWLAVKYAHHIFTVSEFSKNRIMENYHLNPSNITVTYLGAYQKSSAEHSWYTVIAEFGLKPQNYLLYIGRIEPKKNILNMIKGYEMSGSAMPFVLAGSRINTRDIDAYTEARPDLKAKIRFLNYISEEDKQALYRGAAVFLFATLYEGFGLPILEAQCAKTAVITSNTASNPEVAGEGAVFVNPDSPYEIAQAVRQLLNNPVLGQEKIASGLENVKKFQWDQTAEQTLQKLL